MTRLDFTRSKSFTREAERLIPGGAHTYSRGRDQFPEDAPSGFTKGSGVRVRDIDGNELIDWTMGLGSISLGHAEPVVVEAVCRAIQDGVNFQRPTELELEAAKLWTSVTGDDMVKFARHGSSVTTAAVKLARAHTGRWKVACPIEHPFFSFDDWFIGSTACDFGIPEELKRFTLRFPYGDLAALERLLDAEKGEVAAIIMEAAKFDPPPPGYLEGVRALCDAHGIVLILDEMLSGLRLGQPGAQTLFGVKGDLCTWGKGMGNGFAIAALTGRAEIMRLGGLEPEGARKLFLLSSTHGGESVGFAATIATVTHMLKTDTVGTIWRKGEALKARIAAALARHGLGAKLLLKGYAPMLKLEPAVGGGRDLTLLTLLMQEMIARGILFQGLFLMTPAHDDAAIDATLAALDEALGVFAAAVERGDEAERLNGPPIKPVFRPIL